MANIRPNQLPAATDITNNDRLILDQGAAGVNAAPPKSVLDAFAPIATQSEAEAGQDNEKRMTPLRAQQHLLAQGVPNTRSVIAGEGLTGGGTLEANCTIALSNDSIASLELADSAAQPYREVNAGEGLAGGGDLTANRNIALSAASIASLVKADTALQAPGGVSGQILAKSSDEDNDVSWVTSEAATAVSYGPQELTEEQQAQARSNISAFKQPKGDASQYIRGDGTAVALDKAAVGLSNVDNTSDAAKPVSAATQTALNGKYNTNGGQLTGSIQMRMEVPIIQMRSPGGGVGYNLVSNVTDTVNGGFIVQDNASTKDILVVGGSTIGAYDAQVSGSLQVTGVLTAGSKSFITDHPLDPENKDLIYVSTESPGHGVEYWGAVRLINGRATVDVDDHYGMMPGTFKEITKDEVVFLQNQNSGEPVYCRWNEDDTFEIICDDETCSDLIGWQVKGLRKDIGIYSLPYTDHATGKHVPEQDKPEYEGIEQ